MVFVSGRAITLANSIIGVGILAMPFCFKQCGIVLSVLLICVSGLMSRLACHFLLKSAIKSRRRNFEILAFHIFGNPGKFAVEIGVIGFLMGTCVAYFVVMGDLGPQIVAKILAINQSDVLRTIVMIVVSVVCVLPLGMLKDVNSLSNVCTITIGFYICLVLKVISEAMSKIFEGNWIYEVEYWQPSGVLQCLPIFSMSLFCQTQLFEIYDSLPNASLEKMNSITKNAVSICSAVYIFVGLFGYIAFSDQTISGNILTNFSPTIASDVIKMGFVMSLAFSFPLIIFPCRASLYSLLYKKGQVSPHDLIGNMIPDNRFRYLTIWIVVITLLIGLMLPNIELVLGLIGSTIGVVICVIFPVTCFICISPKNTNEKILAQIVLCFGIIIMVLGTYANLQAAEMEKIDIDSRLQIMNKMIQTKAKNLSPLDTNKRPADHKEMQIDKPKSNVVNKDTDIQVELPVILSEKKEESKVNTQNEKGVKDENNIYSNVKEIKLDTVNKTSRNLKDKSKTIMNKNSIINNDPAIEKDDKSSIEKRLEEKKKDDLIDTIRRHKEEQRQIMMEQKKILKEIKEVQQEIVKETLYKIDANIDQVSLENRRKAVENIEKLAKIAIESLGEKLPKSLNESKNKNIGNNQINKNIQPLNQLNSTLLKIVTNQDIVKTNNTSPQKVQKIILNNSLKDEQTPDKPKQNTNAQMKNEDGFEIKQEVQNNVETKNKVQDNLTTKKEDNVIKNKIDINFSEKDASKNINLSPTITSKNNHPNPTNKYFNQKDYVIGGKRDILEVSTEITKITNYL